jgi:glucosamine-6-phosphate deaminase
MTVQIVLCESADHVGARAADIIEAKVRQGPAVLGLATGSSPRSTYRELIRRHQEEQLQPGHRLHTGRVCRAAEGP